MNKQFGKQPNKFQVILQCISSLDSTTYVTYTLSKLLQSQTFLYITLKYRAGIPA